MTKIKSGLVLGMLLAAAAPVAAQQEFIYLPMSMWSPPGSSTTYAKVRVEYAGCTGYEALRRGLQAYNTPQGFNYGIQAPDPYGLCVVKEISYGRSGTELPYAEWQSFFLTEASDRPRIRAVGLDIGKPGDPASEPAAGTAEIAPSAAVVATGGDPGGGDPGDDGGKGGSEGDGELVTHAPPGEEEDSQNMGTLFGEGDVPDDDKGTCTCPPPHKGPYNPSDEGLCATHANGCGTASAPGQPGEPDPGPGKPGEPDPGPQPSPPDTRTLSRTTDWNVDYRIEKGDSLGEIALELRKKLLEAGVADPPDVWGDAGIVALLAQHNMEQNNPGVRGANAIYAGKTLTIPECTDLFEEIQCQ